VPRVTYGLEPVALYYLLSIDAEDLLTREQLLPGIRAKLLSLEGVEITDYNQPGELVVQSPAVVLGYLNNDKANRETFIEDTDGRGQWMRTGDEAEIRKAPSGNEHVVITDRIKELIKVKVSKANPREGPS
jgi:long-subunit acyl-CoA synthetase (AMP-forming)